MTIVDIDGLEMIDLDLKNAARLVSKLRLCCIFLVELVRPEQRCSSAPLACGAEQRRARRATRAVGG